MRGYGEFMDRIAKKVDLPCEPMPGQPIVEIVGKGRVLLENHYGVIQYGREEIRVKVKLGQIVILGRELELARMTKSQLVICGKIAQIQLPEGDNG